MVRGYSGTANYQIVAAYGGGVIQLQSGILKSGTVESGEEDLYYIIVPANQNILAVVLTGNNDADLYIRYGEPPITSTWDCIGTATESYKKTVTIKCCPGFTSAACQAMVSAPNLSGTA